MEAPGAILWAQKHLNRPWPKKPAVLQLVLDLAMPVLEIPPSPSPLHIRSTPTHIPPSIESLPNSNGQDSPIVTAPDNTCQYIYLEWNSQVPEDEVSALPTSIKRYTEPFAWSKGQKNWTLFLACGSTFLAALCPGAYTVGLDGMMEEWHVSKLVLLGALSVFTVGFATAPMFLAPLSEVCV